MGVDMLILGENEFYSMDCHKTKVNNNVLVVGTSGAGKTRSFVTPNLLQATGSYIVSDPKGNLYTQYKAYLQKEGYSVMKLDFTDPEESSRYNFFEYIRCTQDIVKVAHMLIYQQNICYHMDPFWEQASQLLVQAVIAYLREVCPRKAQTLHNLLKMVNMCMVDENDSGCITPLDVLMRDLENKDPDSYAVSTYHKFRIAAGRTLRSILVSVNARLGLFDTPEIIKMTNTDDISISAIGKTKTALFVTTSDTDRSLDGLVNIFFTQALNELCRYADRECKDNCLPVPVRFILDDFATNCRIEEFPRMIASIRSRGISTMVMIQAETQLACGYGDDGRTIIGNCDTYVYLGGNDIETAKAISVRAGIPLNEVLNMPVGTNWIFRRGQKPVNGINYNLDALIKIKGLGKKEWFEPVI